MNISKILAFDVWGEYACFRRPYSTTSPLTFPFPTRTVISGFVAAILGLDRDSYYDDFSNENCKIGINLLSPIRKTYIGQNLIDTKKGFYLWDISENQRTQILFEVLKDVKFRLYLWLKDTTLFQLLENHLNNHTSVYTPYFGLANMLANFHFIDRYKNIKKKEANNTNVSTIVPESFGVKSIPGHRIGRIKMPLYFDKERTPSFDTLIYDTCHDYDETHQLTITRGEYYQIDDNLNIVLI
ncbi:MAG TPA: type I-B CRISPR-associated protein Cas5b [Nitrososphaeraceae archaeon]|nr:type I-B CRISPR-associated protein Cas5b [Nitrososphaeraceae archaeon]